MWYYFPYKSNSYDQITFGRSNEVFDHVMVNFEVFVVQFQNAKISITSQSQF